MLDKALSFRLMGWALCYGFVGAILLSMFLQIPFAIGLWLIPGLYVLGVLNPNSDF